MVGLVVAWNHAVAQRGTRTLVITASLPATNLVQSASAPSPVQSLASGAATAAALAPATNRTVKVTLAWDASPDHNSVSNYVVWFGGASQVYTNTVNAGTNLSVTISNLLANTRYYFAASAVSKIGVTSVLSAEIFWPQPVTNFVTATVSRRTNLTAPATVIWSQTLANPPGGSLFFESAISMTNNSAVVTRLNSSTLRVTNTNTP